jgi:hypothetical protein
VFLSVFAPTLKLSPAAETLRLRQSFSVGAWRRTRRKRSGFVAKNIKKYSHQDTIHRDGHKDFTKKNKRNALNQNSKQSPIYFFEFKSY